MRRGYPFFRRKLIKNRITKLFDSRFRKTLVLNLGFENTDLGLILQTNLKPIILLILGLRFFVIQAKENDLNINGSKFDCNF